MGTCYATCRAHLADWLTRNNGLTIFDANLAQVTIHRHKALTVIDENGIAVEIVITGCRNDAVTGSENRRIKWCRNVHAAVW